MLDAAQKGNYAYPAINVTSITTINAALKAFADQKSDGIIQFSTGAGQFASGLNHKNTVFGTIALAELTHRLADQYDVLIALNTDHCRLLNRISQILIQKNNNKQLKPVTKQVNEDYQN